MTSRPRWAVVGGVVQMPAWQLAQIVDMVDKGEITRATGRLLADYFHAVAVAQCYGVNWRNSAAVVGQLLEAKTALDRISSK